MAFVLLLLLTPLAPPPATTILLLAATNLVLAAAALRSARTAAIRTPRALILRHGILRTRFYRLPPDTPVRRATTPVPWKMLGYAALRIRIQPMPLPGSTVRIVAPAAHIRAFLTPFPQPAEDHEPAQLANAIQ